MNNFNQNQSDIENLKLQVEHFKMTCRELKEDVEFLRKVILESLKHVKG